MTCRVTDYAESPPPPAVPPAPALPLSSSLQPTPRPRDTGRSQSSVHEASSPPQMRYGDHVTSYFSPARRVQWPQTIAPVAVLRVPVRVRPQRQVTLSNTGPSSLCPGSAQWPSGFASSVEPGANGLRTQPPCHGRTATASRPHWRLSALPRPIDRRRLTTQTPLSVSPRMVSLAKELALGGLLRFVLTMSNEPFLFRMGKLAAARISGHGPRVRSHSIAPGVRVHAVP